MSSTFIFWAYFPDEVSSVKVDPSLAWLRAFQAGRPVRSTKGQAGNPDIEE
jgi:hypothetical protein